MLCAQTDGDAGDAEAGDGRTHVELEGRLQDHQAGDDDHEEADDVHGQGFDGALSLLQLDGSQLLGRTLDVLAAKERQGYAADEGVGEANDDGGDHQNRQSLCTGGERATQMQRRAAPRQSQCRVVQVHVNSVARPAPGRAANTAPEQGRPLGRGTEGPRE